MKTFKDKKITFKIDSGRFDQFADYAELEGVSVSALIRHVIIRFIEDRKRFDLRNLNSGSHGN